MKHLTLKDVLPEDYRWIMGTPDPGFSPERNYAVLRKVIAENDKLQYAIDPKVHKASEDRADMIASYGTYRLGGGGTKKLEEYMGQDRMKQIYGERIFEKMRILESVERLNIAKGNTKFKDFVMIKD